LKKLTAKLVVAFILFGLAFADILRWILIATRIRDIEEAKREFVSFYPGWLKNPRVSTLLLIIMLVAAAFIFRHERKKQGNSLLFKIFFIASIVLASWLLFTLL
jgi:biopolymer transport protein ExbB/TolQ